MRRRFWTYSRLRGATLIEALAGLVVLGTLLVSITIARGRFIRQRASAEQKIAASAAVDRLVGRWMAGNAAAIPSDGHGVLEGVANCRWRTRVMEDREAGELGASVVRVEVYSTADRKASGTAIITLDLLRHDDRRFRAAGGAK